MAYSTQADVQNRAGGAKKLREIADWDGDGNVDVAVVAAAIAAADALIDSYASKRFTVPFSPVPPTIVLASSELARLMLSRDRGMFTLDHQARWDELAGTDARKPGWLLQLATGVVTPGGDPLPTKHGTMAPDRVDETLPAERELARDKLAGFW